MSKASSDQKLHTLIQQTRELKARLGAVESRLMPDDRQELKPAGVSAAVSLRPTKQSAVRSLLTDFLPRFVWPPLAIFLALAGGIATYTSLRYDVSVSSLASLNPKAPFESRFLVTNQGPFSIYDVQYKCVSAHVHLTPTRDWTNVTLVAKPLEELRARGTYSVRCQHPVGNAHVDPGVFLEIHVYYRPKFLPWVQRNGGQQFLLKYDAEGNTVWLPTGWLTSSLGDLEGQSSNP